MGENIAIAAMKAGAHDYVLKSNTARLRYLDKYGRTFHRVAAYISLTQMLQLHLRIDLMVTGTGVINLSGIHFGKGNFSILIHDEDGPLRNPRKRWLLAKYPKLLRDFSVRIKIRTHGCVHHPDLLFLPRNFAGN